MNAVLKVNSRGTVTLPKALRKELGVSDGGAIWCSFKEGSCSAVLWPDVEIYTDERIAEFDAADAALGDEVDKRFAEKGWVYDPETRTIRDKFGNLLPPFQRDNEPEARMVCETNETPYMAK